MTDDEILDELDRVLAVKMAEQPSPEAVLAAKRLYGRVRLVADNKDREEGGDFFLGVLGTNMPTLINMLARCYQTLIDKDKI